MVRNPARAACGNDFDFRIVHEQSGRRIGGGRSVGDVAAQRAAILRGNAAGFGCGAAKQRKFAHENFVAANFCVRREGAQLDVIGAGRDAAQFWKVPDVQILSVRQFSRFEQNHQIRAAGEWLPDARILRHAGECGGKIARRLHVISREKRPHALVLVCDSAAAECRTASTTDSKIFM